MISYSSSISTTTYVIFCHGTRRLYREIFATTHSVYDLYALLIQPIKSKDWKAIYDGCLRQEVFGIRFSNADQNKRDKTQDLCLGLTLSIR